MWQKIKDALNGKKTILGAVILLGPEILQKSGELIVACGGNPSQVAHYIGGAVAVIGLIHKAVKKAQEYGVLDE